MPESTIVSRVCNVCQHEFPITSEFWHKGPSPEGLSYTCKKCAGERAAKWKREHRDRVTASRLKNIESDRQRSRNRIKKNPAENRARVLAWQKANPDKANKKNGAWSKAHPESGQVKSLRRRARKRSLPDTFTTEQWSACLAYFHECCVYCGAQQGFWTPITADHYIPLFSPDSPGTVATNMVPACKACNDSKQDKDVRDWLTEKFGKSRMHAVTARIAAYFATL